MGVSGLEEGLGRELSERDDHEGLQHVELPLEKGLQAWISSGSGLRLPGGRHLTTLRMCT